MRRRTRARRAAVLALVCSAPLSMGATGLTTNWQERVLAGQNRERAALGLESLRWSDRLAGSAQAWADHLARSGSFQHAPDDRADPQGENLWAGTKGYYSADAMVGGWLAEKRNFRPGVFPNNSTTGRIEDVGHYTQVVWRETREVGCALARGEAEDVLVCRYSQAGNWIGERPF